MKHVPQTFQRRASTECRIIGYKHIFTIRKIEKRKTVLVRTGELSGSTGIIETLKRIAHHQWHLATMGTDLDEGIPGYHPDEVFPNWQDTYAEARNWHITQRDKYITMANQLNPNIDHSDLMTRQFQALIGDWGFSIFPSKEELAQT